MKIALVASLMFWLSAVSVVHAQKPELVVPIGHSSLINSVCFSPNGRYVLSGSLDETVKLWEVSTSRLIRSFDGHTDHVTSVDFSPDSRCVLSGSRDNTLKLWAVNSGQLVRTFEGHKDGVFSVAFSPDGRHVLSGSADQTLKLWAVSTGQLVRTFEGHKDYVWSVAFSPDGYYALSGAKDATLKLWEISSGQLVRTFEGHTNDVNSVAFSPDGRYALSGSYDKTLKLWEISSGQVVRSFEEFTTTVAFSPDGRYILSGIGDTLKLWEISSGRLIQTFEGYSNSAAFSSDGRYALSDSDKTLKLWEINSGQLVRTFKGHTDDVNSATLSPNGRYALSESEYNTLKQLSTSKQLRTLKGYTSSIRSVAFSPDGRYALSVSEYEMLKLWDLSTGKLLRTLFEGDTRTIQSVAFSADGRYALWVSYDSFNEVFRLWDLSSGKMLHTFNFGGHPRYAFLVAFSQNSRYVLLAEDKTLRLWELSSEKLLLSFVGHTDNIVSIALSPNGRYALSGSSDKTLKLWEISSGRLLRTFDGPQSDVNTVAFSPDGRFIVSDYENNTTKIWNMATGKEIATLIAVDSTDWIVTMPTGLFDASPGAMKLMHYVVNDSTNHDEPWKVIELEQLKQRYYQPGLLPILMGFKKESLRQVPAFEGVALPPSVQVALQTDTLAISLKNRKGGIGRVTVFFNGAEVVKDLRGNPAQDSTQAILSLRLPLARFANRFDTLNQITVMAYNGAGWLSGRPQTVEFRPVAKRRGGKVSQIDADSVVRDARLRAVVVGTSNVGLRFAHKDAEQIANSLSLVSSCLLGADKTTIQLLTTQDGTNRRSTKADIVKALVEAQQTRPQDVFVLYLAGHGVNYGGQDGDFYYLTAGATQADAGYLNEPGIRQTYALSSEELTDLLNQIPSRKKLLILDVCAAGKGAERLVLAARDIPASQIRAMDKLQGRTGFYVLAGSAADAVSYESNVYGQGLLTYSLLQGIRGAALRREGQEYYVDVEKLLNHAVETVPALAKEIRGIQQPFYRAAREQRTFDIGRVTDLMRQQIPLAEPKQVLLVRSFQEETLFDDVLKLKNRIEGALTDLQARGTTTPFLLMEAEDYPNAYALAGRYKLMGERITVICKLFRSGVPVGEFTVQGEKEKLSELAQKIISIAKEQLKP